MKTELKDVIHLYFGCDNLMFECIGDHSEKEIARLEGYKHDGAFLATKHKPCLSYSGVFRSWDKIKPILRPLSDITDGELTYCGKYSCAIPNHPSNEFEWTISRSHNSAGIQYTSPHFVSRNYFSIYNEKNRNERLGHVEIGWFDEPDKRKTRENWKVGGNHLLTAYLLKCGFDLFGLIESGQAIDKTKL